MKDKLNFYIDGQWVEPKSSETIEVINPANENIIGHVAAGTKEDIDMAVKAASRAFESFQYSSKEDRIEMLNNVKNVYKFIGIAYKMDTKVCESEFSAMISNN